MQNSAPSSLVKINRNEKIHFYDRKDSIEKKSRSYILKKLYIDNEKIEK